MTFLLFPMVTRALASSSCSLPFLSLSAPVALQGQEICHCACCHCPALVFQKKLHNAMETSTVLMKDISQRKEMLEKIEINTTLVKEVGEQFGNH